MAYKIKDSGKREEYKSGMVRDTQDGKIIPTLLLPNIQPLSETMIYRWASHLTNGTKKYGVRNWEEASSVEELERFKNSAFRHFLQWLSGENDEDHASAVFFNINAAEYVKWRLSKGE